MLEFQREIPHWKAMRETFLKYDADGWCIAGPAIHNPRVTGESEFKKIDDNRYRQKYTVHYSGGITTEASAIFDFNEPAWTETHPVKTEKELIAYMDAHLSDDITYTFDFANHAWEECGEDILVEFNMGVAFFDVIEGAMGFEEAIMYFMSGHDRVLENWREKYIEQQIGLLREVAAKTKYEAVFIGCGASCNSLLGPKLWRKWDKPYLQAITDEAHKLGLLVHSHNHGKIMETVTDLAEIGFDCVCPFEREPGDVIGLEGLMKVRKMLNSRVTFNGNVNTVATLIYGTPDDVRREVREIKEAFKGSPRLIIGTGDQVGGETPEENIFAMIEEGRKYKLNIGPRTHKICQKNLRTARTIVCIKNSDIRFSKK